MYMGHCTDLTKNKDERMAGYAQEHIYYTFIDLMSRSKLDDIRVNDIVEKGNINRKTFYYHFHGMEDLLKWCLSMQMSKLDLNDANETNWKEKTRQLIFMIEERKSFFTQLFESKYAASISGYLCTKLRPYIVIFIKNCIRKAEIIRGSAINIERKYFEYIVDYYLKGVVSLVEEWIQGGCSVSSDEFLNIIDNLTKNTIFNVIDAFCPVI